MHTRQAHAIVINIKQQALSIFPPTCDFRGLTSQNAEKDSDMEAAALSALNKLVLFKAAEAERVQ